MLNSCLIHPTFVHQVMKQPLAKMKRVCNYNMLLLVVHFSLLNDAQMVFAIDPTQGFTNVPLTSSSFIYQKPYNVPLEKRYSVDNGVRRFWVFSNDQTIRTWKQYKTPN